MARYITESKYPERQIVLDYMEALGINIYDSGQIYMIKSDIHPDKLMRLTNYRGKKFECWVIVEFDDGRVFRGGRDFKEAFEALKYLYDIMRNAESDDDI